MLKRVFAEQPAHGRAAVIDDHQKAIRNKWQWRGEYD
jgi:hypothetical protein